jgi:acyl carrier protein
MQPAVPSSRVPADFEEKIRHLPPPAQAAFRRFHAGGDVAELDGVIVALLEDFIPKAPARPLAELPGSTHLIADLGFDSLAITEVVFAVEDLVGIRIANEEIVQVLTLDDLRAFIRRKAAALPAR